MDHFNVSEDIIPIVEFKLSFSKWFKNDQDTGHPLIITQNGRPAGVLISPFEYDALMRTRSFLNSINRDLADIESGHVYTTTELKEELQKKRTTRASK